ncbi:hypothetical protein, partial [Nostoc sp. UHCC 0251]|uniref:hypothetical protein n=1 Tax=Nostoc sp. UHCC 0251 TaxID=3110240 RepID=UPI002B2108EE
FIPSTLAILPVLGNETALLFKGDLEGDLKRFATKMRTFQTSSNTTLDQNTYYDNSLTQRE